VSQDLKSLFYVKFNLQKNLVKQRIMWWH